MDVQVVRAAGRAVRAVRELEKRSGAFAFSIYNGRFRALVGVRDFETLPRGGEPRVIRSSLPEYPWKTEVDIGGVTFVALLDSMPEEE